MSHTKMLLKNENFTSNSYCPLSDMTTASLLVNCTALLYFSRWLIVLAPLQLLLLMTNDVNCGLPQPRASTLVACVVRSHLSARDVSYADRPVDWRAAKMCRQGSNIPVLHLVHESDTVYASLVFTFTTLYVWLLPSASRPITASDRPRDLFSAV